MKEPLSPPVRLTEFEFRSRLPVIGGVVSALRRAWHGVSGLWALRWLAQQQDRINQGVIEALNQQAELLSRQKDALSSQASIVREQAAALERAQATAGELVARISALERAQATAGELEARISALAGRHAELADILAEFDGRYAALAEALADMRGQIAAAGDLSSRDGELAREARAQAAALAARMEHLESVSRAYLEELGRELAELALKVGAMSTPGDPVHRDRN